MARVLSGLINSSIIIFINIHISRLWLCSAAASRLVWTEEQKRCPEY